MKSYRQPKYYLLAGVVLGSISLLVIMAIGGAMLFPGPPHSSYADYTSPSGEYALIVEYTDAFVFGPHHFFVYGQKLPARAEQSLLHRWAWIPGGRKLLREFDVHNDGAGIDGACSLRWFTEDAHEIARLTCDGQEQAPESYRIDVTKAMRGFLPVP